MFRKAAAAAAALSLVATPCLSAELVDHPVAGERRNGAAVGAYVKLELGGSRSERRAPVAGLRMTGIQEHRSGAVRIAPLAERDTLELRLLGEKKPTFFVAGRAVTGEKAKKNLSGASTAVTVVLIVAAAVGGYYLARAVSDSGGE